MFVGRGQAYSIIVVSVSRYSTALYFVDVGALFLLDYTVGKRYRS